MLKATMTPATIARRITVIADTLDELSNQYTDLAVAVEELKESSSAPTAGARLSSSLEAADIWSGHAMDRLYEAERCLRHVVHFLKP